MYNIVILQVVVVGLLASNGAVGAVIEGDANNAGDVTPPEMYEYIIVGVGQSGSVIAARWVVCIVFFVLLIAARFRDINYYYDRLVAAGKKVIVSVIIIYYILIIYTNNIYTFLASI
jgi:hypothetical protein